MRTHSLLIAWLALLVLEGCPTGSTETTGVRFPPRTSLTPSSGRCQGQSCQCRPLDGGEGQTEENIPAGHKRFELRLPRSTSAIWVSLPKGVFYKAPEEVQPACFYVDLPPGEHPLTLRSERRDPEVGLQTGLTIFEYGPRVGGWYRSLDFTCGGLQKCTKPGMESWVRFQRGLPRGVLDACGSTMIRGVTFSGTREERQLPEYVDLDLSLVIKVYEFETHSAPGAASCRAPVKNQ